VYELPPLSSILGNDTNYARDENLIQQFLQQRRPNIPLAAYGADGVDRAEAVIEIHLAIASEMLGDPSEACTHFARSASLDSSAPRVFLLWADAASTDGTLSPEARRAETARVYRLGVDAGVWAIAEQRPASLISGLTASAWHDPLSFAVCRKLESEYAMIQAEALALLQQDAEHKHFRSYDSKALEAGDWCDVGLYYNGMRNDGNVKRAPQT
jgi:hypothetical protein